MSLGLVRCVSQAGVKRDGTALDGSNYSDATWCRFQRGLPRKIGGYKVISPYLSGLCRALITQSNNGLEFYHSGWSGGLDSFQIPSAGSATLVNSRTPSGFVPSAANTWQFDVQFDNTTNSSLLFAFAGTNLLDPASSNNFDVYFGNVYSSSALVSLRSVNPSSGLNLTVSGGVCSLAPYLTLYGNNGYFAWCNPGFPTDFTSTANPALTGATEITHQKIIRGLPLRGGGGYSPAGLYWSVDSLVRAIFVGITTTTWQFDQLSTQSSILSDRSVLEHDGTYYWAGVDRFLQFNGVMQEIPNNLNLNWFYDGINQAYAAKSFVMKYPRYGEIWWCYPRGQATECSHAVIYNYREKTWYDTPLPNSGRTSGEFIKVFANPMMSGCDADTNGNYIVWKHDVGTDSVNGQTVLPVDSYIVTAEQTLLREQSEKALNVVRVWPDFVQSGPMSCQMISRPTARGPTLVGPVHNFPDVVSETTPDQQTLPFQEQGRLIRFKFESNIPGGNFQWGSVFASLEPSDARVQS